jgi:hypothetical protein
MKETIGDKALYWGTIGSFIISAIGFTAWLTQVSFTATSAAQAETTNHSEVSNKLDSILTKLDELNGRVSHLEGENERHK